MRLTAALLAALATLAGAPAARAESWTWPLRGEVITPYRNVNDPYAAGQHRGIDIAGRIGSPVVAAAGGSVGFAGTAGSSGLTVSVRTADGRLDTSYLHLSSLAVRKGDRVRQGQRIGAVGTTGRRSAAPPHLHFGVRRAGSRHAYLDPLAFLPAPPPAASPRATPPAAVPVGAPARPSPAPLRAPRRVPAARRAPAPRRVRVPARSPRRVPGRAPRGVPSPSPRPLAQPRAVPSAGRARAPRTSPGRAPASRPAAAPGTAPEGVPGEAARVPARPAAPAPAHGPDAGWALACLGLLLAAALVGGSENGRSAAGRGRERAALALRRVVNLVRTRPSRVLRGRAHAERG